MSDDTSMDMSRSVPRPASTALWKAAKPRLRRFLRPETAALAIAAAVLAAQLAVLTQGYYECDPNAYLMSGKQLVRKGTLRFDGSDIFRFHEHMWVEPQPNVIYAKYPPGYPLLLGIAWLAGGDRAMFWVSPIAGAVGLFASFLLMRKVASPWLAVAGALLLAVNPMLTLYNGYMLTHAASYAVAALGMVCLWNWIEKGGVWRAMTTGLLFGFGPCVRYTDALIFLAVPAAIVFRAARLAKEKSVARALADLAVEAAAMAAGAFVCLAPLMIHHTYAFGSPFRTGYDLSGEQSAFSRDWLRNNMPQLLHDLNDIALPVVFPLAMVGWFLMILKRRREWLLLFLWAAPMLIVYGAYYWAPPHSGTCYVRFQTSAVPAYVCACVFCLDSLLTEKWPRRLVPLWILFLVLAVGGKDAWGNLTGRRYAKQLETAARECSSKLPEDAVIFADPPMSDYLQTVADFTVYRNEMFNPAYGTRLREPPRGSEPMRQMDRSLRLASTFTNDYGKLSQMQKDLAASWLQKGRAVAFVIGKGSARHYGPLFGPEYKWTLLASWQSPCNWPYWAQRKPEWELYRLEKTLDGSP